MAEPSSPPPAEAETDRIRETAKWLITTFAAVGGVLVAGSQLSSPLSLGAIATDTEHRWLRDKLEADGVLLPGGDVGAFYAAYSQAQRDQRETFARLQENLRAYPGTPPHGSARDELFRLVRAADSNAQTQSAIARSVRARVALLRVSAAFREAKRWLSWLTAAAAAGIVVFAAAANTEPKPGPVCRNDEQRRDGPPHEGRPVGVAIAAGPAVLDGCAACHRPRCEGRGRRSRDGPDRRLPRRAHRAAGGARRGRVANVVALPCVSAMRARSRQVDARMLRLAAATLALTVPGVLCAESLGLAPDIFVVVGCVLLHVETGLAAVFGRQLSDLPESGPTRT
jgi:hypothetical protein